MKTPEQEQSSPRRSEICFTGLYGRFVTLTPEWNTLVQEARQRENELSRLLATPEEQERVLRRMIAEDDPALSETAASGVSAKAFLEYCLTLRGPFQEGMRRRRIRERARLMQFFLENAPLPDSAEALLAFWERANRLEPRWYNDLPVHFRTAQDHVPFAHGAFPLDEGPVRQGRLSSPPEEIPEAVSRLISFLSRTDREPELLGCASLYLFLRIHPFPDGNGHTARLLCLGLLRQSYGPVTLMALLLTLQENRPWVCRSVVDANLRGGEMEPECCALLRLLIRGQKMLLQAIEETP